MSDTPIFDQLAYEEAWRDEYFGFRQRIVVPAADFGSDWSPADGHGQFWAIPEESTVSVDILPDTTKFRELMRVGGRRNGRSAEWDRVARWLAAGDATPIYYQLKRERFAASMRESVENVRAVFDNYALAMSHFAIALRPHMQAAIDAEVRRQETAAWVQKVLNPAPTRGYGVTFAVVDEMDPRARALSKTNKNYPTSAPSWARKRSS